MTARLPSRQASDDKAVSHPAAVEDEVVRWAPVIVLTYPYAGAGRLWSLLASHPALACTFGTGVLPLCEQAADAWRGADRSERMSPLAAASTRALITSIITAILARQGKRRWCEFATAPPPLAEAFLQLYPGTRFMCLYRDCAEVMLSALHASPWGLEGPEFAPFTVAYPVSAAAALTAFWVAHTEALLEFEGSHPDACHRVRYEDLAEGAHVNRIYEFLGLEPVDADIASAAVLDDVGVQADSVMQRSLFPAKQLPAQLLGHANTLANKLAYLPLTPSSSC